MGENTARCATDSYGRVHGTDDLYIADASLLCGPTMVNPQGTVMAVAHRNACNAIEAGFRRSEEHTSELQSLMRISYAVFCLKKKTNHEENYTHTKNMKYK